MQGLYVQMTRGVHLLPLNIYSEMVCKSSMLDSPGGFISIYIYIYIYIYIKCNSKQGF